MTESTVILTNQRTVAATELTSKVVQFRGCEAETFNILATGAGGTYAIDSYVCGGWRQIDSGVLADGVLKVVTFALTIRQARVRITTPTVASVEAEVACDGVSYVED